jgi:low temperature requirement protein LtrA
MMRRDRQDDGARGEGHGRRDRRGAPARAAITEATVNISHLEERLGIFMIIVLGEAVSQVVRAAGGREFGAGVARAAVAAFLLLVGLWWLTFQYGFAASPESQMARMPARFGLPLHYLTTASVIFLATGLGETLIEPMARMPEGPRWLAAGGLAGFFLATSVGAMLVGAGWRWLLGWGLPSTVLPLVIGVFGAPLASWGVGALLLLAVLWQVTYGLAIQQRSLTRAPAESAESPESAE